ncbi:MULTISPECIES: hypothetical protein [Actinomadura]|uniref:Uncharacterized protein n=1 Tax=Actinomadura litoris TaxID=2678616 RepID=A0A7K1KV74_9ACTN|nr:MULTISPECIES: hypothetical protein [Actinomadura]MBT2211124.1 hypothetical protein [Actinomadura sp. NEAU-AAG7]MUN36043.1 hypothetical protein [Actinomadura litoris]
MNDVELLFETVEALSLCNADFILAGSAPLLLHGLRADIQDLDVVARKAAWKEVERLYPVAAAPYDGVLVAHHFDGQVSIEILNGWFPRLMSWSTDYLIERAEVARGINFMPLDLTLAWKKSLGRHKDIDDIRRIERFLEHE